MAVNAKRYTTSLLGVITNLIIIFAPKSTSASQPQLAAKNTQMKVVPKSQSAVKNVGSKHAPKSQSAVKNTGSKPT